MTNFYSIQFLLFLSMSLICYYTVFRKKQWICLLIASLVFYAYSGVENFVFLLLTGITTWGGAQWIERYSIELKQVKKDQIIQKDAKELKKTKLLRRRRIVMWSVVILNFGLLFYIKFPDNVLGLVLPLGISFYMFQSIGYLLDIYNEKYGPEQNLAKYMLFMAYFPQLIQGPINRYDAIGEQFKQEHNWDGEVATKAIYRIFYGLFKKYAIANIFVGMIAAVFDNPVRDYAGCTVLFGILLYSAQQYADFSGGIDMVLGVSELFGIKMAENFKQPYFSVSLGDFWRRWHISLGKWMRDYVFYSFALTKPMKKLGKLANKRLGKHLGRVLPAALGNILVFFIVGVWHGAQWHYVIWGLYNGVVIALSDILSPLFEKVITILHINTKASWYYIFRIIRTFIVVNIGWYFDRIENVKVALYSLKKTLLHFNLEMFVTEKNILFDGYQDYTVPLAIVACICVFVVSLLEENRVDVRNVLYRKPLLVRWIVYFFVIGMILVSCACVSTNGGFMYANF